jgi:hypothetical protein
MRPLKVGTYYTDGGTLFYVVAVLPVDNMYLIEDCLTLEKQWVDISTIQVEPKEVAMR